MTNITRISPPITTGSSSFLARFATTAGAVTKRARTSQEGIPSMTTRSRAVSSTLRLALGIGTAALVVTSTRDAHAFPSLPGLSFDIRTVSSRPDVVTGGDVLVEVDVPRFYPTRMVRVHLNGADVTDELRPDDSGKKLRGVVHGLVGGDNRFDVYANRWGLGHPASTLHVQNFPKTGPVISGPHEQPYICQTETFRMPDGSTLGPAMDAFCNIETRIDYYYRTATNAWRKLPSTQERPADLVWTTTSKGENVPYIVRIETGTINRAIYQTSVLHDPLIEQTPEPWQSSRGWNGRLVYTFGGGCTGGWYRQGDSTGGVLDDPILRQGYAMASATLNVFGNNCNELTAAETMMMVKERFIEAYGPPVHTIGWGCSGGSYQQHQIADNYPGLLDGILPGCSFPEVGFATIQFISDARLLNTYFKKTTLFSAEQQRQVTGFVNLRTMPNVAAGAGRITPTEFCPAALPVELRYNAITNPTGARCDVYDHTINVYGRDPETGFARRPLDNVGIQYGLAALNAGTISVDQFLELNEKIGGYDVDANVVASRNTADPIAVQAAYRSGRLTNAGLGLRETPIIDYRGYSDDLPGGDIHLRYHSFSMRERLAKQNGTWDNQVMLHEDNRYGGYSSRSPLLLGALAQMDQWLDNIAADETPDPKWVKVIRNKPATLREGCNTRDANPRFIEEDFVYGEAGACEAIYPSPGAPRQVAGAGIASDIIKCELKAIDWADYDVAFTASQAARLASIFPNGVCDWEKAGVYQQAPAGVWQKF